MKPPVEPNKEDCCNSGCNPCIFDVYEKQLQLYKKFIESGEHHTDDPLENGISQTEYTEFQLIKSIEICKLHKLLIFKSQIKDNKKVYWKPGDHFLVKYNLKDISCTKAYTPIKACDYTKDCDFAIVIKLYMNGLVSKYLYNLNEGDITKWRGPYGAYEVIPNKFERIIMIAQGTGIAPFISIIENILNNEDDMTKLFLFYCTESDNTLLFRNELYSYKDYWNFVYQIFISVCSGNTEYKYQEPIVQHKFTGEELKQLNSFQLQDQFLLCGSEKFCNTYNVGAFFTYIK